MLFLAFFDVAMDFLDLVELSLSENKQDKHPNHTNGLKQ